MLAKLAFANTDQEKQTIQAQVGNGAFGLFAYQRFGMKRHAHPGNAQHGNIVGAIPHGYRLFQAEVFGQGDALQQFSFLRPVNDLAQHPPSELAVDNFQAVGVDIIEAQLLL